MWLSLTSGYSVIRCAAIPLLVRSKTPLVFTFFDIFASTLKKNFKWGVQSPWLSRLGSRNECGLFAHFFFVCFQHPSDPPINNNCPRDAIFTDTKKKGARRVGRKSREARREGRTRGGGFPSLRVSLRVSSASFFSFRFPRGRRKLENKRCRRRRAFFGVVFSAVAFSRSFLRARF